MIYQPYFLITDYIYFFLLAIGIILGWWARHSRLFHQIISTVYSKKGLFSLIIITCYFTIGTLDSIHFTVEKETHNFHRGQVVSLFDIIVPSLHQTEKTYSRPLAHTLFVPEGVQDSEDWYYPRLNITKQQSNIINRIVIALSVSILLLAILMALTYRHFKNKPDFPIKTLYGTLFSLVLMLFLVICLTESFHLLGTDKVGNDVLYVSLKSIRTAIILGALTILIMLPFAVFLGMGAGYWGGKVDDTIQFIYTTLSSIPGVLLIIASVLSLQFYIDRHSEWFSTMSIRADVRLLLLCLILGITSWTSLCRVIRAETLKIRELEYVQAAKVLGTPAYKILTRHIFPNVLHIILITIILDFSGLILAEAVLTYVGVGVDPTMYSWGNMIDAARMELARTPIVWWPLASAFSLMFLFVLAINMYVDVLRDAIDPKTVTTP